jgi:hypothetical protein
MEEEQKLVEEFRLAQERVNHFERLIWQIGGILNASILILVGLTFRSDAERLLPLVIMGSILFSILSYLFERRYRQLNMIFFGRMHEIERKLGFRLHTMIDRKDREWKKEKRIYARAHYLIVGIGVTLPLLLFVYWIYLLVS